MYFAQQHGFVWQMHNLNSGEVDLRPSFSASTSAVEKDAPHEEPLEIDLSLQTSDALPMRATVITFALHTKCFFPNKSVVKASFKPVVSKLFLIAYLLWGPYCHRLPPCPRKTQPAKCYLIKSLESWTRHKCDMNKMAEKSWWPFLKTSQESTQLQEFINRTR